MISIEVNNKITKINSESSVLAFIDQLNKSQKGIAIAINEKIVLKHEWGKTLIQSNDKILIIKATQGG